MRQLLKISIFVLSCVPYACNTRPQKPEEILIARDELNDTRRQEIDFKLFSDSTFIFNYSTKEWAHENEEMYRGRCVIKHDTINFFPFRFKFTGSDKAIIKGGFVEFLNGKRPLKIFLRKSVLESKLPFDTALYSDYAFFTYDTNFHHQFHEPATSIDLNNNDLNVVDSLINSVLENASISRAATDYNKQCISVRNSRNEKVVWINLLCKGDGLDKEYQRYIVRVDDGGDCYIELKINIDTLTYYDLYVNGDA